MTDDQRQKPGEAPSRLDSWKEIAAFFGRSVRTVQRWEREAGLPVHRYPTKGGEAIFAQREELQAWVGTTTAPANGRDAAAKLPEPSDGTHIGESHGEAKPARSEASTGPSEPGSTLVLRRAFRTAVALLAFVALGFTAWLSWPMPGDPARIRVEHNKVAAFDAAGALIWTTNLPYSVLITQPQYDEFERTQAPRHRSFVEDLDGDRRSEAVVMTAGAGSRSDIICYDANGRSRWRRQPDSRRATYGERTMASPWCPLFFTSTEWGRGGKALWAAWGHFGSFGSFVERLDVATGDPASVFWSAGFVTAVALGRARGRQVLLLGADHNESKGASLAVYDLSLDGGSPPAETTHYTCFDCPDGRPLGFFVFPKTRLSREALPESSPLYVELISQDSIGQIRVVVQHGFGPADPVQAAVAYWFDSQLRLTGAEVIDNYRLLHRRLEAEGRLKQPFSSEEERELFPVRSWEKGRFIPIMQPTKQ